MSYTEITQAFDLSRAYYAADLAHDFEAALLPTGWATSFYGDLSITRDSGWSRSGSYSALYSAAATGWGYIGGYVSFAAGQDRQSISAYVKPVSLVTSNKYISLFGIGRQASAIFYTAQICKKGGIYIWSLRKDGSGATHADSVVPVTMGQEYEVTIRRSQTDEMILYVDGVSVASIAQTALAFDYAYVGGINNTDISPGSFYLDDIRLSDRVFLYGSIEQAANGDFVVGLGTDDYKTVIMTSPDKVAWTLRQTIDEVGGIRCSPYSMVSHNGIIYFTVEKELYASTSQYKSQIWKSVDNGVTWAICHTNNDYLVVFSNSVTDGGSKIAVALWQIPHPDGYTQSIVDFGWYDTSDDTLSMVTRLATVNVEQASFPSEVALIRRPSDNNIVAIIRWGEAPAISFQTLKVTSNEGASWSVFGDVWTGYAGFLDIVKTKSGKFWCCGYFIPEVTVSYPAIWQVNLDTGSLMEVQSIFGQENAGIVGNGQIIVGAGRNEIHLCEGNGSVWFYTINVASNNYVLASDVKLLLHLNGADGSTTIIDSSAIPHSCLAKNGAKLDTGIKALGSASLEVTGSVSNGTYVEVSASSDWTFGTTDDFTVGLFLYITSKSMTFHGLISATNGVTGWELYYQNDDTLHLWSVNDVAEFVLQGSFATGQRYWVQLYRRGGVMYLDIYKDRTRVAAAIRDNMNIVSTLNQPFGVATLGGGAYTWNGRLDEVVVSKGRAVNQGSAPLLEFNPTEPPPITGGYSAIHRRQRLRRAA